MTSDTLNASEIDDTIVRLPVELWAKIIEEVCLILFDAFLGPNSSFPIQFRRNLPFTRHLHLCSVRSAPRLGRDRVHMPGIKIRLVSTALCKSNMF